MKALSLLAVSVLALAAVSGCRTYVKSLNELPPAARATLEKEAADGGNIGDIQKRHRHGAPYYLAEVRDKDGKWHEVSVVEDGRIIDKD